MIVVTFALPAESSVFIRLLKGVKREGALLRGNIEHRTLDLCVLHTGVGTKKCAECIGSFLGGNEKPELLIASGFCGGTSDELHPGDVVIAENVSDPTLLTKAQTILAGAKVGKIHSADRIIDPAADRYAIGRDHGAIAVDMETETIARHCAENSIKLLALRVVSDSPGAPFPAPPNVLFDIEKERTDFSRLLGYIARNPTAAIGLAAFSKQIASAKTKLAEALCAIIRAV
jgi:nucleoside phosphorylase